jgi:hypothetical protein
MSSRKILLLVIGIAALAAMIVWFFGQGPAPLNPP